MDTNDENEQETTAKPVVKTVICFGMGDIVRKMIEAKEKGCPEQLHLILKNETVDEFVDRINKMNKKGQLRLL
jgi:hypothetical protein